MRTLGRRAWTAPVIGLVLSVAVIVTAYALSGEDAANQLETGIGASTTTPGPGVSTATSVSSEESSSPPTVSTAPVQSSPSSTTSTSPTATSTTATSTTATSTSSADTTTSVTPPPVAPGFVDTNAVTAAIDTTTVELIGAVQDQQTSNLLTVVAQANANDGASVTSNVVIDPTSPADVGLRIVRLDATFDSGSADVTPSLLEAADRAFGVLTFFPEASVVVVGHAGVDEVATSSTLASTRAQAFVARLIELGLAPPRATSADGGPSAKDVDIGTPLGAGFDQSIEIIFYGLHGGNGTS